jgi:hypothetical protein
MDQDSLRSLVRKKTRGNKFQSVWLFGICTCSGYKIDINWKPNVGNVYLLDIALN